MRLRTYKKCDAELITKWIGNEFLFRQWCADRYESYPITADDMNKHYDGFAYSDSFYPMTAFDENGIVGHLIMRFTDDEKAVLRFGFVIVDDTRRGKGVGKEMLKLALKYAFEILKADKVTLGVFVNNESAYYCYKAVGFKDAEIDEKEYYHILNEDRECKELEITLHDYMTKI